MIGEINRGSSADCDTLPGGTLARLILMNYNDINRYYFTADGKITMVIMKPGKKGYEFTGFRTDVKKSEEVTEGNLMNRFLHRCNFVVYDSAQAQKVNLARLVKGRFVAIVESNGKSDDSIEVLGICCGLEVAEGRIQDAYQFGGVFTLGLTTPTSGDETERKLPQTLGVSYNDGRTIIDGILQTGTSRIHTVEFDPIFN